MKFKNLFKKKKIESPPQYVHTLGFKQVTYLDENNDPRTALVPIHLNVVNNIMPEYSNQSLPKVDIPLTISPQYPSPPHFILPKRSSIYTNSTNDSVDDIINTYSEHYTFDSPHSIDSNVSNIFKTSNNSDDTITRSSSYSDLPVDDDDTIIRRRNSIDSSAPTIISRSSVDSRFSNIFKPSS